MVASAPVSGTPVLVNSTVLPSGSSPQIAQDPPKPTAQSFAWVRSKRDRPSYQLQWQGLALLAGSLDNDVLSGETDADLMFGFAGADSLRGQAGNDQLFGGDGDDFLQGQIGDDQLFGENGNDFLDGGAGQDTLQGGAGDDSLIGGEGDDRLLASEGFDNFNGGPGTDTADYSAWGDGVSLKYGVSFVQSATGPVPQGQLLVEKGGRSLAIAALAESDRLASNEIMPDEAMVLELPVSDHLSSIEVVIGPAAHRNQLDFSFRKTASRFDPLPAAFAPPLDVNLAENRLTFGEQSIKVYNFVKVVGSVGDDRIVGDRLSNILQGGQGHDLLLGGDGNDLLITAEKDSLTGGPGADRFQLTALWSSYSGRSGFRPKRLQASTLEDFEPGVDQLWLSREFEAGLVISEEQVLQYVPFYSLKAGPLAPEQFWVMGQGEMTPAVRLIYDGQTGSLFYRGPEVYQGFGNTLLVATLAGGPALRANDIVIL